MKLRKRKPQQSTVISNSALASDANMVAIMRRTSTSRPRIGHLTYVCLILLAFIWRSSHSSFEQYQVNQEMVPTFVDNDTISERSTDMEPNSVENSAKPVMRTNTNANTIVTAYFAMDAKHSQDLYRGWMSNMLSLSDNMVIFTTPDMVPTIAQLRLDSSVGQTRVIGMHLQDFYVAKLYNTTFWEHQYSIDPEGGGATRAEIHAHKTFQLYQIWNEKTHFLKQVADWNPFQSDFFAWVDIGYFRTNTYNHQYMLDVIPPSLKEDQVLMLEVSTLVGGVKYVGGGFIGGHALGVTRWHHYFYQTLDKYGRQSAFIGKDQPIMYKTCEEQPGLCKLVAPRDGYGDLWFFMAPYLNKNSASQLQGFRHLRKPWTKGRIGNQLFEWASTLGIASKNGMVACMDSNWEGGQDLLKTFVGPFRVCPPKLGDVDIVNERLGYARYQDFALSNKLGDAQFEEEVYLQSFKYFSEIVLDIQQIYRFKDEITSQAKPILEPFQNMTTVGIHVRRGDMLKPENTYLTIPSVGYYEGVMQYFRKEYGNNVAFLVASDDYEWCSEQDVFRNVTLVKGNSPSVDLAVLAGCQHMVISVGTFGWWAAWLGAHSRGGQVVYFSDHFNMDHPTNLDKVVLEDYFPDTWMPMGNDGVK